MKHENPFQKPYEVKQSNSLLKKCTECNHHITPHKATHSHCNSPLRKIPSKATWYIKALKTPRHMKSPKAAHTHKQINYMKSDVQ